MIFLLQDLRFANVSSSKETQVIGLDLLPLQSKTANGQRGNNNILSTGEMSFEMIKWKRLAVSAPVNQTGPGYMASCSVATICTVFSVWPVAGLLLLQTRSVTLRGCCDSPQQPRLVWADPSSCCHTRLLWRPRRIGNHQKGQSSSICKKEAGNTHNVVPEGWHALWCHNVYLIVFKYTPDH